MKLFKQILILLIFLSYCSLANAQHSKGTIIDVFGENITVQLFGNNPYKNGDKVDVSYVAGMMEIMVGQYEITAVQDQVFIARNLSLNIPPSKEMNVNVGPTLETKIIFEEKKVQESKKRATRLTEEKLSQTDPFAIDYTNMKDLDELFGDFEKNVEKYDNKDSSPLKEDLNYRVQGEVVKVVEDAVFIMIKEEIYPQRGYKVELYFVTSGGKELPVGIWRVEQIDDKEILAKCYDCQAPARKGLKAIITGKILSEDNKLTTRIPLEIIEEEHRDFSPSPDSSSSDIDRNLFSSNYGKSRISDDVWSSAPGFKKGGPWKVVTWEAYITELKVKWEEKIKDPEYQKQKRIRDKINRAQKRWVLGIEIQKNQDIIGQSYATGPLGLRIKGVEKNSAAELAGLQIGDIVYKINNVEVSDIEQFLNILQKSRGKIVLTIDRNLKEMNIKVKMK